MAELTPRVQAILQVLPVYFTGKPCKHGHIDKRYTSSSACVACIRIADLAYRQANREKLAAKQRLYNSTHRHEPLPSAKQLAIAAGQKLYFTGKPCSNGHIAKRLVNGSKCVDCIALYRANETSKQKGRESSLRYYHAHKHNKRGMTVAEFKRQYWG